MRRIYLPLIALLCGLFFYLGTRINRPESINSDFLESILHQRDSLTRELEGSEKRVEKLTNIAWEHQQAYYKSDSLVGVLKRKRVVNINIGAPRNYTIPELDSFFVATYPAGTKVRSTKEYTMLEWRAREVASDRLRLDSCREVVSFLTALTDQQQSSIKGRDMFIEDQKQMLSEKDFQITVLIGMDTNSQQQIRLLKDQVKKERRQKKSILAGAGVVVGIGLVALLKG